MEVISVHNIQFDMGDKVILSMNPLVQNIPLEVRVFYLSHIYMYIY